MNERLSVIVPVYNREALMGRCLDSIAVQDWPDMEIIIVDNNSSDDSMNVALEWASANRKPGRIIKVLSEERRGACAARNCGLRVATGKFINFFDSDDTMRPHLVQNAMRVFMSQKSADIVCWPCCIHQLDGTLRVPAFQPERPVEGHMIHTLLRPQGYIARKHVFDISGGWNENLPGWNDWELGVRILLQDFRIGHINDVLADIYAQNESITGSDFSSKAGVWEKSLDAAKEAVSHSSKADKEKKRLLRIIAYREIILAAHYAKEKHPEPAEDLKRKALNNKYINSVMRQTLRMTYFYTRKGGRGAWHILRHLL